MCLKCFAVVKWKNIIYMIDNKFSTYMIDTAAANTNTIKHVPATITAHIQGLVTWSPETEIGKYVIILEWNAK